LSPTPLRFSSELLSFITYPATTEFYTLSLHDALPISVEQGLNLPRIDGLGEMQVDPGLSGALAILFLTIAGDRDQKRIASAPLRSEEHTSELQSRGHLVCRLLLEKKKNKK